MFSKAAIPLYSYQQQVRLLISPHPHQHSLSDILVLAIPVEVPWYSVGFHFFDGVVLGSA